MKQKLVIRSCCAAEYAFIDLVDAHDIIHSPWCPEAFVAHVIGDLHSPDSMLGPFLRDPAEYLFPGGHGAYPWKTP